MCRALLLLVIVDTAQSVATGLYVMPGFLTMIMMAYVVLTMLSIGIWFLLQGQRLSAMLKRSAEISPTTVTVEMSAMKMDHATIPTTSTH